MSDTIAQFLQERIDAGDFPSAVYLVAEKGRVVVQGAVGSAVVQPESIEARIDTIYDLASLTKPLVTALLAAMLIEDGVMAPDYRVATLLSEFEVPGKRTITVLDLATHTSHLPAWMPFYLSIKDPAETLAEIATTDLEFGDGDVIYSDLNFMTLAAIVERFGGSRLDELAGQKIFGPLALKDTAFNPTAGIRPRIAASEWGNGYEQQTSIDKGYLRPENSFVDGRFRKDVIWGEVHDNNAKFMGGVAGHAGLFSTASETMLLAEQFVADRTQLFKPETCELFTTNFTEEMNEGRSFGFQLASTPDSTAGTRLSRQSFGHNGFTGTSVWIDPESDRIFVLLTNRTHCHSLPFININSVRRTFHDLAIAYLNGD
ncbi:MAG: serine hydrolase [Pyrinomonadaceae bacterium]